MMYPSSGAEEVPAVLGNNVDKDVSAVKSLVGLKPYDDFMRSALLESPQ